MESPRVQPRRRLPGTPLPSAGSPGAGFPASPVVLRCCDHWCPSRRAQFPSPSGTAPAPLVRSDRGEVLPLPARRLVTRPPPGIAKRRHPVPPRFLESPVVRMPRSKTPPGSRGFSGIAQLLLPEWDLLHHRLLPSPTPTGPAPENVIDFEAESRSLRTSCLRLTAQVTLATAQDSVPAVANFAGWD